MAETTYTFKNAALATKSGLAGANGNGDLAPGAVLYGIDGTQLIGQQVRAASLPVALAAEDVALLTALLAKLLAAPATEAKQDTGNTSLAAILAKLSSDPATQTTLAAILAKLIASPATEATLAALNGKAPALGQALAAASVPVILPTATITTLTPPAAITGFATAAKQPALGTAGTPSADVITVQGITSGTAQPVTQTPVTSGGLSLYRNIDLGVTGVAVKASAGQLYQYYLSNSGSAARFVKFYDKASAATSGDTPVATIALPAGAAANLSMPNGLAFALGISVRATTGVADADTGAPGTNEIIVNLGFK